MRVYPKEPREPNDNLDRKWVVKYRNMIYDGGGTASWDRGYHTFIGARIAAFYHYHIGSWGGAITIERNR